MKTQLACLFSTLCLASTIFASAPNFSKTELAKFPWQAVEFSQNLQNIPQIQPLAGTKNAVLGYKIPANQGTIKLKIKSLVVDQQIFVPNVLVLDANYNVSLEYPAKQFKQVEERGLEGNQLQAELNLTPVSGQDFIYLLIYTTEDDLKGESTFTHPAKLYAKAKGNQPPAIADITVKHSNIGKIELNVEGSQSSQFIGLKTGSLNGALFEAKPTISQSIGKTNPTSINAKPQPVEQTTEQYFNQAVKNALKNNDINKAMNLVAEAEKLGLTTPRQIFLKQVSAK